MTFAVEIAPLAQADLDDIEDWLLDAAGPRVAAQVIQRVYDRIAGLQEDARTGTPRPEYGIDVRFVTSRPYLIYFDLFEDRVTVLRILHGAKDRDTILRGVQEEAALYEATA